MTPAPSPLKALESGTPPFLNPSDSGAQASVSSILKTQELGPTLLLQIQDSGLPASSFQSPHPSPPALVLGKAQRFPCSPSHHCHTSTCGYAKTHRGPQPKSLRLDFHGHISVLSVPLPCTPLALGLGCGTLVSMDSSISRFIPHGPQLTGPRNKVSLVPGTQACVCTQSCTYTYLNVHNPTSESPTLTHKCSHNTNTYPPG